MKTLLPDHGGYSTRHQVRVVLCPITNEVTESQLPCLYLQNKENCLRNLLSNAQFQSWIVFMVCFYVLSGSMFLYCVPDCIQARPSSNVKVKPHYHSVVWMAQRNILACCFKQGWKCFCRKQCSIKQCPNIRWGLTVFRGEEKAAI